MSPGVTAACGILSLVSSMAAGMRLSPPAVPELSLLDFSQQRPVEDGGSMHVASVACGASYTRMPSFVKTFAAQARLEGGTKPVLHLFLDERGWKRLLEVVRKEPGVLDSVDFRPYNITQVQGMPTKSSPHGKRCMEARLHFPRIFTRLQRLIYLDVDVIVLNSLKPLWRLPVPVLSMGENDEFFYTSPARSADLCPTWRNGTQVLFSAPGQPGTCWVGPHGLNSGAMIFNLTGWRAHDVDRELDSWLEPFLSGELDMRQNDQDILNLILLRHPDYLAPLPCEANIIWDLRWVCLFNAGGNWESWIKLWGGHHPNWEGDVLPNGALLRRNERRVTVLHSKFGQGVRNQGWRYLYGRAIQSARLVNQQGLRNASSLCDVFGCEGLVMEEAYACPCQADTPGCECDIRQHFVEDNAFPHAY